MRLLPVCLASLGVALPALASATPEPFIELAPPQLHATFTILDVDEDGSLLVGGTPYNTARPYTWSEGIPERLFLAPLPEEYAIANAVTPDGRVIVGGSRTTYYPSALVWRDRVAERLPRPDIATPGAEALDVSADGRTIVGRARLDGPSGYARDHAARWVDGVLEILPDPPGPPSQARVEYVSEDASVAVGYALVGQLGGFRAVRWSEAGVEVLPGLVEVGETRAKGVSGDGRIIVGWARQGERDQAVRWVDGALEPLGALPGSSGSRAYRMSGDGDLVFGTSYFELSPDCAPDYLCSPLGEAFVWTPETGMLPLEEWMRFGCGFDVVNWHINAVALSGDASSLVFAGVPGTGILGSRWQTPIDACRFDYEIPEWTLGPGDYLMSDIGADALYAIHRETGEPRRLISHNGIFDPDDVVMGPRGGLYVSMWSWNRIVRYDLASGEVRVVTDGGLLDTPLGMTIGADGTLFALNSADYYTPRRIVGIDPESGAQRVVSEGGWIEGYSDALARRGSELLTIAIVDGGWVVVGVDIATGAQRIVTPIRGYTDGDFLARIAYDAEADALRVGNDDDGSVLVVDLGTGLSTVQPDALIGAISVASNGDTLSAGGWVVQRTSSETGVVHVIAQAGHLQRPRHVVEWLARCRDRMDNDGDGLVDAEDPACTAPDGDSEQYRTDVAIDIQPFDPENRVALEHGWPVRVALLGSAQLDVTEVDFSTLAFGPGGAAPIESDAPPWRRDREFDVNRDGHTDRVLAFDVQETGIALGDTEACLQGEIAGTEFRACDAVETLAGWRCGGGFGLALVLPIALLARRHRPPR